MGRAKRFWFAAVLGLAVFSAFTCSKSTEPVNHAPSEPIIDAPSAPAHGQGGVSITPLLRWKCTDPDRDAITFDVRFGKTSPPTAVSIGQSEIVYSPGTLDNDTKYYWRIAARDEHGATSSSDTWDFTTVALAPSCSLSQAYLDFGDVCIDQTRNESFAITNVGGGLVTGSVSENCSHYSIVSGGGSYSLGAGQARLVTVQFAPTSTGTKSCEIETGNDACRNVSCTGVRLDCILCGDVEPLRLNFGEVCIGQSADRSFTISNCGTAALIGSVGDYCSDFSVVSGGGSYSLEEGESRTITVRFTPTSTGRRACEIQTGSALDNVSCTGEGQDCSICCDVAPISLDFGQVCVGQSADRTFTISSCTATRMSGSVSVSSNYFSIVSGGGSYFFLKAGQSRTVTVRFTPTSTRTRSSIIQTGDYCPDVSCIGYGDTCPPQP
jgi:hypothetical protein